VERQRTTNRENSSDTNDDNDGKTRASVASSRRSNSTSRAMTAILNSIKKPPSASLPTNNNDNAKDSRNSTTTTTHAARSTTGWSVTNTANSEPYSPPLASLPTASPQGILHSPTIANVTIVQHSPHAVAAIQAHEQLDDASSSSATENDNAKSMRLLNQYFQSLAQSRTTRSIMEEKGLITAKISLLFKCIKFINTDTDLTFEGNIAKVLYKEMHIPDNFKAVWGDQMKNHVRKKMDER